MCQIISLRTSFKIYQNIYKYILIQKSTFFYLIFFKALIYDSDRQAEL